MDSYLSNIDTYMQQQQQQARLLKRQQEQQQQQLLLQQQQQQQQQQQNNLAHLTSNDSIWLSNIPGNPLPQTPEMYSNPTLYMSNPTSSPSSYSTTPVFNHQQLPNYPLQPSNMSYEMQEPVRQRKKPGRKPNPASPALRKAQNRAAQRAFRERKERHLKDLETTIRNLRDQRNHVTRELNAVKSHLESYKAESWYLKGVVLTLQFVCMHHNINIPTHSPYLSEEALVEMARTAPHAIEAYVNSYTRNNSDLNRTYQFAQRSEEEMTQHHHSPSPEYHGDDEEDHLQTTEGEDDEYDSLSPPPPPPPVQVPSSSLKQEEYPPISSSMDAIQQIRLKLGILSHQQQQTNDLEGDDHLKPTILQLAIPHDPRIDLVPTPHMRDRMIIFRDQMDYDRCFTMLLNEAVYHGGDPTKSESWELPSDFFSEFWYLTIDYDIRKTNKWRRIKGLSDVEAGPQIQQQQSRQLWNDDQVLDQIVKNMPSLQPMAKENSPSSKYFYNMLMREPPESRRRLQSPTLGKKTTACSSIIDTDFFFFDRKYNRFNEQIFINKMCLFESLNNHISCFFSKTMRFFSINLSST
jgi:hypothetical protein